MTPSLYDPTSEEEQPLPLPSAQSINLSENVVLQPPLSRRGNGPGIVIILPSQDSALPSDNTRALDPKPLIKWAEEGFSIASVTSVDSASIEQVLKQCLDALQDLDQVDVKDKFAVIGEYSTEIVYY